MDAKLLNIKAIEQKIMDYLSVYRNCRTKAERLEIQQIIHGLEIALEEIRRGPIEKE